MCFHVEKKLGLWKECFVLFEKPFQTRLKEWESMYKKNNWGGCYQKLPFEHILAKQYTFSINKI